MAYNKDEIDPPKWMDIEFFEHVLNDCKKGNFKNIVSHEITPATAIGDHFASIMFRVQIKYLDIKKLENEITLIVKTMPELEGIKQDLLKDSKLFETEIRMYKDIIPKFEEILRKVGDNTILGAKMLYSSLSPRKIIIFEDLVKQGYETIGKRLASLEEAQLALAKLAKWHAVSLYYNKKTNGELESFVDGAFSIPGLEDNDFFGNGMEQLIKLVKIIPEFQQYLPKLEKINKKLMKKCIKIYEATKSSAIQVLNHGDFHTKNMMFQYDKSGKVKDVMLVDFQICVWSSMAIDILYCIYMLIDFETRIKYMKELQYNFFNTFLETLKKIGYDGKLPVYTDLQIDFIKYNYMELFLVATFLPFIHTFRNQSETQLDPAEVIGNVDERFRIYKQQSYIDELKILLPILLYKGYLDGYDD